jgi:cobaltochelatase CobN
MEMDENSPDESGDVNGESVNGGESNNDVLVNGTTQEKSESADEGGRTAFGISPGETGDAKAASESSQESSQSAGASNSAKTYELSKKSASKAVSSTESNIPIFVIIAVIALIAIFLFGYVRNQDEDDEY